MLSERGIQYFADPTVEEHDCAEDSPKAQSTHSGLLRSNAGASESAVETEQLGSPKITQNLETDFD